MSFTKHKFLKLSKRQQHKQCASLLRELYLKMCGWIEEEVIQPKTLEIISNRYHHHLQAANWQIKEHDFLPKIGDTSHALPLFPITIYLDNIRSAHNVGSILRTIEAFSLGSIVTSRKTPDLNHKQVKNTSMGTWKYIKRFEEKDLYQSKFKNWLR